MHPSYMLEVQGNAGVVVAGGGGEECELQRRSTVVGMRWRWPLGVGCIILRCSDAAPLTQR